MLTRGASSETRTARMARSLLAFTVAAACVLMLVHAAQAESRPGWWLQVKSAACAQGPKVLLGDIALPQGDMSPQAWKEMAARPLWAAPERQGHQTAISRERLAALLRQHAEDIAGACVLPQQLMVQRGGAVISGQELSQQLVEFLTGKGPAFNGEIELKDVSAPEYVFLPGPRDRMDIEPTSPLAPGRVNLLFAVRSPEGKVLRRYAASAFVNVWRALPMPSRPFNRLEQLDISRVQFKRANLAFNADAWDGTGGPWRMARSVGAGQVIKRTDIEPVPVIAKGEKVNLVYEGQSLRLVVKVEALADGGVGQAIEVRNLQSNRKIMATVQDAATVVVR